MKGIRLRHLGVAAITLVFTLITYAFLYSLHPWLQWGWWSAIGGNGSILFLSNDNLSAATQDVAGAVVPAAQDGLGLLDVVFTLVFLLFLGFLLYIFPKAAHSEEVTYRKGAEHRSFLANLWKALVFGLIHLLMGIPIAAALALTVSGLAFTLVYLRAYNRAWRMGYKSQGFSRIAYGLRREHAENEGVMEAARVHFLHNAIIVLVLMVLVASSLIL